MNKPALLHSYACRVEEMNDAFEDFLEKPTEGHGKVLMMKLRHVRNYVGEVKRQALREPPESAPNNVIPIRRD